MPKQTRERQGERSLLQIALDVRMTSNGSMSRSEEDNDGDAKLLLDALKSWIPTFDNRRERFDNAVKEILKAALDEWSRANVE